MTTTDESRVEQLRWLSDKKDTGDNASLSLSLYGLELFLVRLFKLVAPNMKLSDDALILTRRMLSSLFFRKILACATAFNSSLRVPKRKVSKKDAQVACGMVVGQQGSKEEKKKNEQLGIVVAATKMLIHYMINLSVPSII